MDCIHSLYATFVLVRSFRRLIVQIDFPIRTIAICVLSNLCTTKNKLVHTSRNSFKRLALFFTLNFSSKMFCSY